MAAVTNEVAQAGHRKRGSIVSRSLLLALARNVLAWLGAAMGPSAQAIWPWVSLVGFFVLGLTIGRWWALLVTAAFGVIHAIPVVLGLLPGYLSSWGEAIWWAFALTLLVGVTAIGVVARWLLRRPRTIDPRPRRGDSMGTL